MPYGKENDYNNFIQECRLFEKKIEKKNFFNYNSFYQAVKHNDLHAIWYLSLYHEKFQKISKKTPEFKDYEKYYQILIGNWILVLRDLSDEALFTLINIGFLPELDFVFYKGEDSFELDCTLNRNFVFSKYIDCKLILSNTVHYYYEDLDCFLNEKKNYEFKNFQNLKDNPINPSQYRINTYKYIYNIIENNKYFDSVWSESFRILTKACRDSDINKVTNILISGFLPKDNLWILGLKQYKMNELITNLTKWMSYVCDLLSLFNDELITHILSFINASKNSWEYLENILYIEDKKKFIRLKKFLSNRVQFSNDEPKIEKIITKKDLSDILEKT